MPHAPRHRQVTAILGPTNTGKTHYAVERMLGHASGMIGFPLRLLAREVYDRVVKAKGPTRVALITGEEKIVPPNPSYWICTVESMPLDRPVAFLAVDEIQMATDWQRGHIFTDRLLRARGSDETLFMGSEAMRPIISRLVPDAEFMTRPRFSQLSHIPPAKLSRLPRRSAVVAFSAESVYAIAELVRRQRGGAAIVMGALSPRTRNAQVAMYQAGEVDYLVATDAIGMGLNMDIDHVAFAATNKFDGQKVRELMASEVGQIAGRAGRHTRDGTFSTIGGESQPFDPLLVGQVEEHEFPMIKTIRWRNARPDMTTLARLIRTLEDKPPRDDLQLSADGGDMAVLKALAGDADIQDLAISPERVRLLWEVCQVPDFRKISLREHAGLVKHIFCDLCSPKATIDTDWLSQQVSRLDNTSGDIDTLAGRIANIRTWTYVANRARWLTDAAHWAHVTRGIEDKLSDALHERLTQRFVDRRTSVLMRQLRQRGALTVTIDSANQITVEGHVIGHLEGFTFHPDPSAAPEEYKTLESAAGRALQTELVRRAKIFGNIGYKTLSLDTSGGMHRPALIWQGTAIAHLVRGSGPVEPDVKLAHGHMLDEQSANLVRSKCMDWLKERIADKLEPLVKLQQELSLAEPSSHEAPLTGLARGVAFQLAEAFGVLPREQVDRDLRQLDQDARKGLRRFGIRIGATTVYMPPLLKPHAVELRLILWSLWTGRETTPTLPTPGLVTIEAEAPDEVEFYTMAGFRVVGKHAVRIDMLERLADAVRPLGQKGAVFEVTPEIMGLVGCSGDAFVEVMGALNYTADRKMEPRPKPAPAETTDAAQAAEKSDATTDASAPDAKQAAAPADDAESTASPVVEDDPIAAAVADAPVPAADQGHPETANSTAELPVTEDKSAAEGPAGDTGSSDQSPRTEDLVERLYFRWGGDGRANRPQNRQRRGERPQGKTGGKPGPRAKGKRPGGKPGGRPDNRQGAGGKRPQRKEKPIDKDNPFYQLKALKEAMEKKK